MAKSTFIFLVLLQSLAASLATVSHDPNDVAFYLFPNPHDSSDFDVLEFPDVESIKSSRYDPTKRLIIYSSGFGQNRTSDQYIKDAYLATGTTESANVIILEWGKLSGSVAPRPAIPGLEFLAFVPLYIDASRNVDIVGNRVSQFLTLLHTNGLLQAGPANVHLIGTSLGAHLMGMAGMYFQHETGSRIGRITGLDPAGPLFQFYQKHNRLDASDADFVSVLHTNQGLAGFLGNLGDADIYVNGDFLVQVQPECKNPADLFCSHQLVVLFYAMSVLDRSLVVTNCNINWIPRPICEIKGGEQFLGFGESFPDTARGSFYINNLHSGYFD